MICHFYLFLQFYAVFEGIWDGFCGTMHWEVQQPPKHPTVFDSWLVRRRGPPLHELCSHGQNPSLQVHWEQESNCCWFPEISPWHCSRNRQKQRYIPPSLLSKTPIFLNTKTPRPFVFFPGPCHPCTLLFRRVHWSGSEDLVKFTFKNLTRFSELMVHKPEEGLILCLLATILSPLVNFTTFFTNFSCFEAFFSTESNYLIIDSAALDLLEARWMLPQMDLPSQGVQHGAWALIPQADSVVHVHDLASRLLREGEGRKPYPEEVERFGILRKGPRSWERGDVFGNGCDHLCYRI